MWEYRVLYWRYGEGDLQNVLNGHGKHRWELVSDQIVSDGLRLIFKRPILT